jgi:septum site-determining protein MinC
MPVSFAFLQKESKMYQRISLRLSRPIFSLRAAARCFSGGEQNSKVRKYLDAWVGSPTISNNKTPCEKKNSKPVKSRNKMEPLLLSGSSYLIPTLRIERSDTPDSIATRIAAALEQDSNPKSFGVTKSMLQGKTTASGTQWLAPIILDLAALAPDGSHHYSPPSRGLLLGLVEVLQENGIRVIGVTNTPPVLEKEAIETLQLPSFMSKGRVLDRQSATSKINVEDVVRMLLVKSQEECKVEEVCSKSVDSVTKREDMLNDSVVDSKMTTENEQQKVAPIVVEIDTRDNKNNHVNSHNVISNANDENDLSVPAPYGGTHVFHGSVRSGQQVISNANQSLIVIGSVNSGGEVMSDRDIFVFGKLRGRALAGLANTKEDETARIFATSFDPELICIGDTFTTVDTVSELGLDKPGEAAMVTLDSKNRELIFQHIPL